MVADLSNSFCEKVVGYFACNLNSIHSTDMFLVDPIICGYPIDILVVCDFLQNNIKRQANVFQAFNWSAKVEVGDIHAHILCSWIGQS